MLRCDISQQLLRRVAAAAANENDTQPGIRSQTFFGGGSEGSGVTTGQSFDFFFCNYCSNLDFFFFLFLSRFAHPSF